MPRPPRLAPLLAALLASVLAGVVGVPLSAPPATASAATASAATASAATASAESIVDRAASALRADPVYVDPSVGNLVSAEDVTAMRARVQGADPPVYVAVLPTEALSEVGGSRQLPKTVYDALSTDRAAVVVLTPRSLSTYSSVTSDEVGQLANQARSSVRRPEDRARALVSLVNGVVSVTAGADRDTGRGQEPSGQPGGSGGGAGLVLLGLLAVGGAGLFLVTRSRRRARAAEDAQQFEEVHAAAEEDVTRLGEDVAGLDLDVADPRLDEATRGDYRRALDAYDAAKAALEQARRAEDLQAVSSALEEGRYAMTCVRARLAGQPVPERRPPCFFNPQHGPSATEVEWAPAGGAPRQVPVCALDAERLARGEDPDARQVLVGGQRRPYWEAGPAYGPWAGGYYGGFGTGGLLPGLLIGTMLGGGFGHGGWGGGFGGGDFGGGGFGGGDFGGGDFGGGDFGGGDF